MKRKPYEKELRKLQVELCHLQRWVTTKGLRVVIVFEGRDAAGKGGTIRALTEKVSPRVFRVVALPAPSDREKTQMFFQRYMLHFPAAGEIVIFDRSWYNRAGVEHVMGFCSDDEYQEFLHSCPIFEEMLVRSGIYLIKYWFSVNDEEQERRFQERIRNPIKRWKLSPMDVESRKRWVEYSMAKDVMFEHTPTARRRRGTSSPPMTRSGPGSIASGICSIRFPTRTCGRSRSSCLRASWIPATSGPRSRSSVSSPRSIEETAPDGAASRRRFHPALSCCSKSCST